MQHVVSLRQSPCENTLLPVTMETHGSYDQLMLTKCITVCAVYDLQMNKVYIFRWTSSGRGQQLSPIRGFKTKKTQQNAKVFQSRQQTKH